MKATGIVRKVDELGRIVIPKELRRIYQMGADTSVEIYTDGDRIVLQKYEPSIFTPAQKALEVLQNQHFHDTKIQDKITELAVLINGDKNG